MPSTSKAAPPPPPTNAEVQSSYAEQLAEVPEFANYGPALNSSTKPTQLTESETEYQVSVVKHIFKEHIVFQVSFVIVMHDSVLTLSGSNSSTYPIPYPTRCWIKCP